MLFQQQPFANHNGGTITFGPDGMLYVAFGDGGGGGDPSGTRQNKNTLLGQDPAHQPDARVGYYPYSIPADNPFVGQPGARWEVWMYGLRNPWKFSFDKATGDMWIGDVGQGAYEEIDFAAAGNQAGANWGWNLREGRTRSTAARSRPGGRDPIIERAAHRRATARSPAATSTAAPRSRRSYGAYLYGDFCTGKIYAAEQQGGVARAERRARDHTCRS